jgi:hypothetical protein
MNYLIKWHKDDKYAVHPEKDEESLSFIGSFAECKGWIYNKTGSRFDPSPLDRGDDWIESAKPKSKRVVETGDLLSSHVRCGVISTSDIRQSLFGYSDSPNLDNLASMKESLVKSLKDKRRKLREDEEFFVLTEMLFYVDELRKTQEEIKKVEHQLWLFEWERANSGCIAPGLIDLVVLGQVSVDSHIVQPTRLPAMSFEDSEPVLPWAIA